MQTRIGSENFETGRIGHLEDRGMTGRIEIEEIGKETESPVTDGTTDLAKSRAAAVVVTRLVGTAETIRPPHYLPIE